MKILADFHHNDLARSLQLLFARFGGEVVFPYGVAWFEEWVWQFERPVHGDAVARQYLEGLWEDAQPDANGYVEIENRHHPGTLLRGITLEAARSERWDIVLSTVPANAPGFSKLAAELGAAFGLQIGNQWGDEAWDRHPAFALLSATVDVPNGIPSVLIHQEFDLDIFRYEKPHGFGPIRSFVNCFPETPEYPNFTNVARQAPDLRFEVYGALGTGQPDEFTKGNLDTAVELASTMRGAGAIWHAKHWSDGFGHVIHNAFAVGRPVFGYARYYRDKLAGPLWVEGETSFDVEGRAPSEVFGLIRRMQDEPDWYVWLCENAARRFREVVNFDEDAAKVEQMLGLAVPA